MFLLKNIGRSVFTWLIASVLIILIILMPRDAKYEQTEEGVFLGAEYVYSFDKHVQAVKEIVSFVIENHSLGMYNDYYSINDILILSVTKSFGVIIPAIIIGFFLGLLKGMLDYRLSLSKWNIVGKGTTWFFLSVPDFFVVISIQLGLMYLYEKGLFFYVDVFGSDKPDNFIMATIYLMIYPLFYIARIVSTAFEVEERKDYIRTAKSKGISYNKILYKHVLWNCWVTIMTNLSSITLYMLSNLFIIEKFMGYQGAGYYFFSSIFPSAMVFVGGTRDLGVVPLAIAFTLIFTFFILIVHIISHFAIFKFDKNRTEETV
ncbi:ABC transporter permease subunit [Pseudoneobacillus sp. C159]